MKTFLRRLIVTLIALYGLGAVAYGLLHYPAGERPGVGGILSDYNRDVGSFFRRKESEGPAAPGAKSATADPPGEMSPGRRALSSLDDVRNEMDLSLGLAQVYIPDSAPLTATAAQMWDTLRPIHDKVLPEGIEELGRLRSLASTDKDAFQRDRTALRARLATARATLLPRTKEQPPLEAAVQMLEVLDRLDTLLAAL